jgi:hypothetical protein
VHTLPLARLVVDFGQCHVAARRVAIVGERKRGQWTYMPWAMNRDGGRQYRLEREERGREGGGGDGVEKGSEEKRG